MKTALIAAFALFALSGLTAHAQVAGIHCAGQTFPPTRSESYFYFTIDRATNEPTGTGFRFVLYNGAGPTHPFEFPGSNVTALDFSPGTAGELRISASMVDNFETTKLDINYEGNDFGTRIPVTAVTKAQKERALMNLFKALADTGSFGHISKDPLVSPSALGGMITGFAPWENFQNAIRFQNVICARY